ncbi:MAG: D-glycero-beta-D-manno-heptose-7-phosphate kinase [Deltaproteobacteria bacterium]
MMTGRRLNSLVAGFARARVLVVGDLMLDRFIWGDVERISPEAPVPVVRVRDESEHLGGAGNVVANLAALGTRPSVVGWIGRDAAGRALQRALKGAGADASGVITTASLGSIEKTRILAQRQQVVRLDREADLPGPDLLRRILRSVESRLADVDAVIVSDYGKGTIREPLLTMLAEARERHGFAYLIDPKQPNYEHYRGATLMKPNASEAEAATGLVLDGPKALREVGRRLLSQWQSDMILVSRGERGMALCRPGRAPLSFAARAREVFDVTGAGDTVLATAALVLAAEGTPEEAAELANHAAGVVVAKVGTATLTAAELVRGVKANERARRREKR